MPYLASCEDLSKLLEGFRPARTFILINDVRVMPFFQLQELSHFWEYTYATFLRGCKHLVARDFG